MLSSSGWNDDRFPVTHCKCCILMIAFYSFPISILLSFLLSLSLFFSRLLFCHSCSLPLHHFVSLHDSGTDIIVLCRHVNPGQQRKTEWGSCFRFGASFLFRAFASLTDICILFAHIHFHALFALILEFLQCSLRTFSSFRKRKRVACCRIIVVRTFHKNVCFYVTVDSEFLTRPIFLTNILHHPFCRLFVERSMSPALRSLISDASSWHKTDLITHSIRLSTLPHCWLFHCCHILSLLSLRHYYVQLLIHLESGANITFREDPANGKTNQRHPYRKGVTAEAGINHR